jgi:hypothetical protein
MAKILIQFAGAASIIWALSVITSSSLQLNMTIQERASHGPNGEGVSLKTGLNVAGNVTAVIVKKTGGSVNAVIINGVADVAKAKQAIAAVKQAAGEVRDQARVVEEQPMRNLLTRTRRHAFHGGVSKHTIQEYQECLARSMLISSFGIVLGIFQLLLAVMCCCAMRLASRCIAGMWILGNLICLFGVGVLLAVSLRFSDCFEENIWAAPWLAFTLSLKIDVGISLMFIITSCYALPRIGSSVTLGTQQV